MQVRAFRQELLAGNIANADTPGYRARDINFKAALEAEMRGAGASLPLLRDNPRQFSGAPTNPLDSFVGYRTGGAMGIDGNNVNLSQEEARFTSNALGYEADLTFLTHRINALKLAIKGN